MSVSQPRPFRGSRWFKGNLHAHTELSDGALSPARVVEIYKKHNYDFLAVTDHDLYDACPELSDEDFLILPGGEFAINNLRGERTPQRPEHSFDIVFYLKDPDFPNRLPAGYRFRDPRGSEGFDARLREHRRFADETGNFCVLAHPSGSGHFEVTPSYAPVFGAIEVYNHSAEVSGGRGSSEHQWDYLLRQGHRIWGIASDDAHFKDADGCGGWIMVSCDRLDTKSVMSAIEAGSFYATTGPQIFELYEENGEIVVKCSPCSEIRFVQFEHRGKAFHSGGGEELTEARFAYDEGAKYVRVECIRADGRKAWSNPFFVCGEAAADPQFTERTDPAREAPAALCSGVAVRTAGGAYLGNPTPLHNGGKRFKGNLHAHTTNSDGDTPPDQLAELYRKNGYAFLAITDHQRYTNTTAFNRDGFITLPGAELSFGCGSFDRAADETARQYTYHINGVAYTDSGLLPDGYRFERPRWSPEWLEKPLRGRVQEAIDFLAAHGNLVMFNHPNWSRNRESDVFGYEGLFAMEIYNHLCEHSRGNGYSQHFYSFCLRNHMPLFCTATDDTHKRAAACGGWVVVDADSLSRASIGDALRRGCFYASNGPEIHDWRLDPDGFVRLECSGARSIRFWSNGLGCARFADDDIPLTGAKLRAEPGALVCAEVAGFDNTFAWTNPIRVR